MLCSNPYYGRAEVSANVYFLRTCVHDLFVVKEIQIHEMQDIRIMFHEALTNMAVALFNVDHLI